ncbi:MAG: AAA family ATPase [Chloroflexota bacterium]
MISCPSCATPNKAGARFCVECGTALPTGCPSCGAPFEPGQKFCGSCGSPLGAAAPVAARPAAPALTPAAAPIVPFAPAPVAERRLVSVLFADLVGFTPFAAERDAEDVRETLSRYFDLASEVIGRYGGTVEKFIGDAVMAVWGVPTAHEDDAERAVRAAMDLVDAVRTLGPTIQARAGVLTGEAAVTLGATNQGMVAGDLVNTAARLQSVAAPGTVLAGEPTMRAASKAIAFEPAGAQNLKGKESPVPAWRALRIVAEVGGRNRQEGLEAPFVGRDDEMRALKDQFHASARDRRVRLVSVVGPAGIGKSRLAWEFLKHVDGLAGTVWWHQGRSPAYGQGVTFWALGEMVRARCGLLEGADERSTRARVAATVAEHVPDEAERRWIEPALLALLGVGDRAASSEQLYAAWRTFFERLAATAPVVLLFEDLHWADAGTLDFIDHVLDWTRDLPITVITLARPELLERRADWGAGRRHFLSLFLEPLPEPAMRELLAGLVPGLPPRAVAAIVARADGIPLYAVETVRSLLADGRLRRTDAGTYEPVGDLSELAVPETLTALIASRLDALDPADRSLLQDAAVLGQSFTPASLSALVGTPADLLEPRLRALVRRELLVLEADPRSPERGQYAFVQALIREVAYNTLSKRDRKAKHLAAARWFETLGSDELAGALARHYLAAWQATPEGPEADALAGQARLALKAAADRSIALYANEAAVELLREAASVTPDLAERSLLLSQAGLLLDKLGRYEEEEAIGREAYALALEADDGPAEASAVFAIYYALVSLFRRAEAMELVERTAEKLAHLPTEPSVLRLRRILVGGFVRRGDRVAALALVDELLPVAEASPDRALILELLQTKAGVLSDLDRKTEAFGALSAVASLAAEAGRMDLSMDAQGSLVTLWYMDRDPVRALALDLPAIEYQKRTGNRYAILITVGNGVEIAVDTGDWAWAETEMRALLEMDLAGLDRAMVLHLGAIQWLLRGRDVTEMLAEADGLTGDTPGLDFQNDSRGYRAFLAGDLATAIAEWREMARLSPLNAPFAFTKAARAALWAGEAESVERDLAALAPLRVGRRVSDLHAVTLEAGLAALRGDRDRARAGYRAAIAAWRELRLPWPEAVACLDLVIVLGPDDPDAPAAAERAREVFTQLGAAPYLAKLDAVLGAASTSEATA